MFHVVVIGCRSVGAFAANLLGSAGLSTVVIERQTLVSAMPRAMHADHEMVRLLQSVGLSESILADMFIGEGHLHINAGGGAIRFMGSAGGPRPFGWANDYFFYQPELEKHLPLGLVAWLVAPDEAGDLADGVGAKRAPPLWMKPGDMVEVDIGPIGILHRPIAVAPAVGNLA